jgi:pimeloyl-ACP methyl ester carboxylesterase
VTLSELDQTGQDQRPLALDALVARYDPAVMDLRRDSTRIRLRSTSAESDVVLRLSSATLTESRGNPDAILSADDSSWRQIALDQGAALNAFGGGRLRIERNLHLGIGFLAATSGSQDPGRLRFRSHETPLGRISTMEAGTGEPLICLPGLGGTKASFLTTVAALAPNRRVIAIDLPGFGDSSKPLNGGYDAAWFARAVVGLLDALGLDRADLIGNSMGGRVALEVGLTSPERARKLILLSPAMAWLHHDRALSWLLRLPVSRLGVIQPAPRAIVEPIVRRLVGANGSGWMGAGIDEFLRGYCTVGGRYAFYESARNIFRDEPHGDSGFWRRLESLAPETLFVWGTYDQLVPIAFMRHVEAALPSAAHLELRCGHVPQLEAPERTHAAVARFLERT